MTTRRKKTRKTSILINNIMDIYMLGVHNASLNPSDPLNLIFLIVYYYIVSSKLGYNDE